jgi:hypothetical protein
VLVDNSAISGAKIVTQPFSRGLYKDTTYACYGTSHFLTQLRLQRWLPTSLTSLSSSPSPYTSGSTSRPKTQTPVRHSTFPINPSPNPNTHTHSHPTVLAALKPAYEAVIAEPENTFFEVFQNPANAGEFRFVEHWNASVEWFMNVRVEGWALGYGGC